MNAPSPNVSLMEIAWIQQKIEPPNNTPTLIDFKQSCSEAWRSALRQNGSRHSDAKRKRTPIKPKGGNPWIACLEKTHPAAPAMWSQLE